MTQTDREALKEAVARVVDPDAWSFADRHAGKPVLQPEVTFETRRSLTKAEAILSIPAIAEALGQETPEQAYKRGWNDQESDFLVGAERVAQPPQAGTGDALRIIENLSNLREQFEQIAALHPNDQPHYPNGVRPFGTGDLRHFIASLTEALADLTAGTVEPDQVDMICAGASDTACHLYPGVNQSLERAAFVAGVAHQATSAALSSPQPSVGREEVETALRALKGIPAPFINDGEVVAYRVSEDVPEDIHAAISYLEAALLTPAATDGVDAE